MTQQSIGFNSILIEAFDNYRSRGILTIDLSNYEINSVDKSGNTALHITINQFNLYQQQELSFNDNPEKPKEGLIRDIFNKIGNKKEPDQDDGYIKQLLEEEKIFREITKILLKKGADFTITNNKDETPLHLAARSGSPLLVETFLENINSHNQIAIYSRNIHGDTPLHIACHGYYQFPSYYNLENSEQDNNNSVASSVKLLKMLETNYCRIIDGLLNKGAEVNSKNNYLETPLHIAIKESRNAVIVGHLLAKAANLSDVDIDLNTVFHIALSRQANTFVLVKFLLQQQGSEQLINFANKKGLYPLHLLAIKEGIERSGICKLLLTYPNFNLNIINFDLETPLFYAVQIADKKLIELLLEKNMDINHRNIRKETPLYAALQHYKFCANNVARQNSMKRVIKFLLKRGANPDADSRTFIANNIDDKSVKELFAKAEEKTIRKNSNIHKAKSPKASYFQAEEAKMAIEITLRNIKQLEVAYVFLCSNPGANSRQFYDDFYNACPNSYEQFLKQVSSTNNSNINSELIVSEIKWAREEKYKLSAQIINSITSQWQLLLQLKNTSSVAEANANLIDLSMERIKVLTQQYYFLVNHEQFFEALRYLSDKNRIQYILSAIEIAYVDDAALRKKIETEKMLEIEKSFQVKETIRNGILTYQNEQLYKLISILYDITLNYLSYDKSNLESLLNNIASHIHADFRQIFCSNQPENVIANREERISQAKQLENRKSFLQKQIEEEHNAIKQQSEKFIDSVRPNLKRQRANQDRSVINKAYELIHEITLVEAKELFQQTGVKLKFKKTELTQEIIFNEGQYGLVGLARKVKLNAQGVIIQREEFIAVKEIEGHEKIRASQSEALLQFLLQARLKQPSYIMPLYDSVEELGSEQQPVLYQFMPLAGFGDGEVFQKKLHNIKDEVLFQQLLIYFAKVLLTAVSNIHQNKIYHLDIKPSNIIFDMEGNAYLIDFGCAQRSAKGEIFQRENGDKNYYSPERLAYYRNLFVKAGHSFSTKEVEQNYDAAKVDAWAIGLTFFEVAANYFPLDSFAYNDKLNSWDKAYFQQRIAIALSNLPSALPPGFVNIIKGLLEIDPKKRLSVEQALDDSLFVSNEMNHLFTSSRARKIAFQQLSAVSLKQELNNNREVPLHSDDYQFDLSPTTEVPTVSPTSRGATEINLIENNQADDNSAITLSANTSAPVNPNILVNTKSILHKAAFLSPNQFTKQSTKYGSSSDEVDTDQKQIIYLRELAQQSTIIPIDENNISLIFNDQETATKFNLALISIVPQEQEKLRQVINIFGSSEVDNNNIRYAVNLTKDEYNALELNQAIHKFKL